MKHFYLLVCLLIFSSSICEGQTILDYFNKENIQYNNRYAIIKSHDKNTKTAKGDIKKGLQYSEAGILFIPALIEESYWDTITYELIYNTDATCTSKSIHSLTLDNSLIIEPSFAEQNCLSIDTSEGYKAYQIQFIERGNVLQNLTWTSRESCEEFEKELKGKISIEENTIKAQPELEWWSIERWNSEGKTKMDTGIMDSAYEDEKGNRYILFEAGYYSKIRLVLCSSCYRKPESLTLNIQKALLELNYDVELTDIMNDKTKAAITQFQKDNELPSGQLNVQTLRVLGIQY